jgi:DNA-binding MltR family transcriptional regulator
MANEPSELGKKLETLFVGIAGLQKRAHASSAILGTAIIDVKLRQALLQEMRPIGRTLEARIFDGYGPLRNLSAKIDMAYALDLITKDIFEDLKIIKDIRNAFAHPKGLEFMNFSSPEVLLLLKRLHSFTPTDTNYQRFFLQKLGLIEKHLEDLDQEQDVDDAKAPS